MKFSLTLTMVAKALLVRPNVAALCMMSSTRALSCLRAIISQMVDYRFSGSILFRALAFPIQHCHRTFCIRASNDSDNAASIGSSLMESMERKIKEELSAESVVVEDAYGDGRHVSIDVISSAFEGQSAVNRQRMVYKAIWAELQNVVHAVDKMTTRTPSEALGK
ncbi:hypothetical protein ACJIZ3_005096 [Penstemon smallii]|uniref:Uncharacterized protein n=1 Tax=Penstemon smallii TaxID=265156 RepID=A0ABD3S433_9LAMI